MKKNENKTNKRVAALNYFTSLCFYIVAIINFINGGNKGVAIMFLCLGSTYLCLGSVYLNKDKDEKNNNDKE